MAAGSDAAAGAPGAVVDVGTNTVLMLAGRRRAGGTVEVWCDRAILTRLGEGLGRGSRMLRPEAVARTLAALDDHLAEARRLGIPRDRVRVVATAGVRKAANPEAFLEPAAARLGRPVELLSGEEEARLSHRSVAVDAPPGPVRVLDIGGGSTELTTGEGDRVDDMVSFPFGSVHLWEELAPPDPPGEAGFDALVEAARGRLAARPVAPLPVLYAVAGTATTTAALLLGLSAYDRGRVDGSRFAPAEVADLGWALADEPLAVRQRRPCLPPGRADVIVAGIAILVAALERCGATTLVVRDRGHRYALLP